MKHILSAFLVFILVGVSFADTPAKVVDGKVVFAVAKIDNVLAWSQKEKDGLIESMTFSTMTAPVVLDYTSSAFELRVSTSFQFRSYSAYLETLTMTNQELTDAVSEVNKAKRIRNFKRENKD